MRASYSTIRCQAVQSCRLFGVLVVLLLAILTVFAAPFATSAAADTLNARQDLAARLSSNVNISVPSRVNYVAKSDGTLIAPSPEALYLRNDSEYEVRVSSVKMESSGGWNFVDDVDARGVQNAVELSISPLAEPSVTALGGNSDIEAVSSTDATIMSSAKTIASSSSQTVRSVDAAEPLWTMTVADSDANSENTKASTLRFEMNGEVANVTAANARGTGIIGTTRWYVVSDTVTNDFEDRIAELESDVANLENDKEALQNTVATLQSEKAALENRVGVLETEKTNMAANLSAAQGDISSLQSAVGNSSSGLTKQVGDLSSALGNSSSGLTKRVGDAESSITNLQQGLSSKLPHKVVGRLTTQNRDAALFTELHEILGDRTCSFDLLNGWHAAGIQQCGAEGETYYSILMFSYGNMYLAQHTPSGWTIVNLA